MAEAVGLRSALLHCSSFRYFHSPCRVLCTFRSPYLCNIGCRADRGVLTETPRRIRLQVQAALHRRRQQNAGGPLRGGHLQEHARSNGNFALCLAHKAFPCSCTDASVSEEKCAPLRFLRFVHPSPVRSARGRRPRREVELHPLCLPEPRLFPALRIALVTSPCSAICGGVTPCGSHSSLAVTEKDTVVFSSSANRYA